MNALLEPFLYETVTGHQQELRRAVRNAAPTDADGAPRTRAVCLRMHWCSREQQASPPRRLLLLDPR